MPTWTDDLPPDVAGLLGAVTRLLGGALGPTLTALYVHGSLVSGDFAPTRSDVDLLAVLTVEPDEAVLARLRPVHDELDRAFPVWRGRVEVEHVAASTLRAYAAGPPYLAATIARVSPGEHLHLLPAAPHRVLTWSTVHATGRALVGPPAARLVPRFGEEAATAALLDHVRGWPVWVRDMTTAGGQAYAVLTVCRATVRLRTGRQVSKKVAADLVVADEPASAGLVAWARHWWYSGGEDNAPTRTEEVRRFVEQTCARLLAGPPTRPQT